VDKAGIMQKLWRTLSLVLAIFLTPSPGLAQVQEKSEPPKHPAKTSPQVRHLGAAEGWSAYTYKGHSGQVCYITGFPAKREPASIKRKSMVMMVTHRPEEHVTDVVSFDEGYLFKNGSDASLDVDGTKFDLFTKGDTAWSRTSDLDKAIVAAMAKGNHAAIDGTPAKGPPTNDTYSLAGFSRALALIDKACGVAR
jgi:Invasion associated locus B (IalB) protein